MHLMTVTAAGGYTKKSWKTCNIKEKILEKEKTVRFDKYTSQAMKGIAIVMMLFHHQYLSRKRFEGFTVSFAPFADDTMIYMCSVFKICVPIYAFISGYGLYLSYRKKRSAPVRWTAGRLVKTMSGFWIIWILSAAIFQGMFGYVSKVYFSGGSRIEGLAAMGLDFLGLHSLFGTVTMNGTWWYMSAAVIFVILVPLVMKNEDCLPMILALVVAVPHMLSLKIMGETNVYSFIPVFLLDRLDLRIHHRGHLRGPLLFDGKRHHTGIHQDRIDDDGQSHKTLICSQDIIQHHIDRVHYFTKQRTDLSDDRPVGCSQ